jgi:cytochrome b561
MGYGTVSRLLHWVMAVMILVMIPVGLTMIQEGLERSTQDRLFILHKNMGTALLALIVIRVGWRLLNPPPPLPAHMPPAMQLASRSVHVGLYVAIAVMAASGYARVRMGGFPIEGLDALGIGTLLPRDDDLAESAKAVHATVKYALVALIGIHVVAAAYHGIVRQDGIMRRMWPPVAPAAERKVG